MRKRIVPPAPRAEAAAAPGWLEVDRLAEVELTSEATGHPIESALRPEGGPGWRAAEPGLQMIRLRFDMPQRLRRIRLVFDERETARTQEFVLRWSTDGGRFCGEIVRQQYTFSPSGSTREVEDYTIELDGVTALELSIVPDISGSESYASLSEWRIA